MKQTAVEFLLEKYKSQNTLLFSDDFIEALEMEKQQLKDVYTIPYMLKDDFETYYNETYKKP